MHGSDPG